MIVVELYTSLWYSDLMKYYAVQVKTTQEEKYIQCAAPKLAQRRQSERLLFLRRRLPVRKGGKTTMQLSPLFPGYVFLETEDLDAALHNTLRRTPGFFRFLRSTQQPTELCDKDLATLHHFMSFGEVVEPSAVHFDENDRIVVDSGPLKGLEGRIVKVDRRKNRAKIQLDMYTDNFLIDLAFQVITKGSEQTEQSEQSERSETEQAERGERIERLERIK